MLTLEFPFSVNEVRKYLYGSNVPVLNDDQQIVWNGRKREQSDASGLCVNCWEVKPSFMMDCQHCGNRPKSVDEFIYSIAVSGIYYDPPTLRKLSGYLASGQKSLSLSLEQMDALRPAALAMLEKVNAFFEAAQGGRRGQS